MEDNNENLNISYTEPTEEGTKAFLEATENYVESTSAKFKVEPAYLNDYLDKTDTQEIQLINIKKLRCALRVNNFFKRCFDIIISFTSIMVLSPLLIALLILDSISIKGWAIYSHKRLGYRGKVFKLYKFQSMRNDKRPEEEILNEAQLKQLHVEFKVDNDPRVTRFGCFMRKTSLDELPQLFNVLNGTMSLVGPRPVIDMEIELYYSENKEILLSVKPGLTGYWQAYGRSNVCYRTGERQNMELYYIKNRSLLFDAKIICKTFISVLKRDGAQ